jgi:RHS repeat-associated protein
MGAVQVPSITGAMQKQQLTGPANMVVRRNGWLYVYVSNESNQDVYFDDIVINHKRGPEVEMNNYYAFGLEIPGLNSKAVGFGTNPQNRDKYNGKELQSKEFNDGSGLEDYDFGARNYDPQIGRWFNIDPLSDVSRRWSPYCYVYNNPLIFTDPNGMFGDYYKKDGSYLGSDGINDNKLYAVENNGVKSSSTDKDGNTVNMIDKKQITDVTAETGITHSDFLKLAAVVYGETDQQSKSKEEKFGIASASVNNYIARSKDPKDKGATFSQVLNKISNATFDGNERYGLYNSLSKHDRSQNQDIKDANAAAINALTGGRIIRMEPQAGTEPILQQMLTGLE